MVILFYIPMACRIIGLSDVHNILKIEKRKHKKAKPLKHPMGLLKKQHWVMVVYTDF